MSLKVTAVLASGLLGLLSIGVAQAQHDRGWDHRGPGGPPPGWNHMDGRFGHNHYYPERGFYVRDLPRERVIIGGPRGGRYWYSGGVWYSNGPRGYVVIGAPVGAYVPVLPPYYSTVYFGGVPYYYANDTYYIWSASNNQYEVVDAPGDPNAASTDTPPPPPSPNGDVFVYPKNGQSDEQQSRDKYECHKWAQGQSGFDPTQPNGGVSSGDASSARASYQRAMSACLEGRGYSVK